MASSVGVAVVAGGVGVAVQAATLPRVVLVLVLVLVLVQAVVVAVAEEEVVVGKVAVLLRRQATSLLWVLELALEAVTGPAVTVAVVVVEVGVGAGKAMQRHPGVMVRTVDREAEVEGVVAPAWLKATTLGRLLLMATPLQLPPVVADVAVARAEDEEQVTPLHLRWVSLPLPLPPPLLLLLAPPVVEITLSPPAWVLVS